MKKEELGQIKKIVEEATEPHFAAIQEEFQNVNKRFEDVDRRFDEIDRRISCRIESLERRIIAIEDILTEHGKILRKFEKMFNTHWEELKSIKFMLKKQEADRHKDLIRIMELERRVARLETKVFV